MPLRYAMGAVAALACLAAAPVGAGKLKVLDKPLWIFPGQTFRVALEQAAGAGDLSVRTGPAVEVVDSWAKDTIQRFYFRSLRPGDATLTFSKRRDGNSPRLRAPE